MNRLTALAAALVVATTATPAWATCPASEPILDELTCSSTVTGRVNGLESSDLGGSRAVEAYSCGTPYPGVGQTEAEDVYSFTCQRSGSVTLNISGLDCDLDIYILDDSCDPFSGCEAGSTRSSYSSDGVSFTCTAGDTYYVVIEGYGFGLTTGGPGQCSGVGEGDYTLSFDISAGTGCSEDCDNGTDDDFDGYTDCADSDCASDPICDHDADGDGHDDEAYGGDDCDDTDAAVHPGADEYCNGYDDDCDGTVDESSAVDAYTWYRDADTDGYGNPSSSRDACTAPSGYVSDYSDCDDGRSSVHPGATETCNGIDDDCDGSIDESGGTTWYRDGDSDGYGTATTSTVSCSAPTGYVSNATDCNDANGAINPAAAEVCDGVDNDCDGATDESGGSTWYRDADGDGYGTSSTSTTSCSAPSGYVSNATDCNDGNSAINPAAAEVCDGVDNDCDGATDESGGSTWYRDADGDGYGTASSTTTSCSAPTGYVSASTDCDDANSTVHPYASEVCDGLDNDCDGSIDEDGGTTWYRDADGDGYGSATVSTTSCSAPSGYVGNSLDCDDSTSAVSPAGIETCNGIDDDCDGSVDESGGSTWYRDSDRDGYGDPSATRTSCSTPSGYVSNDDDCDDSRSVVNPAATEACNGYDDDCDGLVDESGGSTWYADTDGDLYGDPAVTETSCSRPTGYSSLDTDCDDSDPAVNPAATELCDGIDNDCDGSIDEAGGPTWYVDADSDGYGSPTSTRVECTAPAGYVATGDDCDDTVATVHPGADEYCNDVDDDCDGAIDEDALDATVWYTDGDGDGYGDSSTAEWACDAPADGVATGGDCWDDDASVNPGAPEDADGVDQDCDGVVDEETDAYDDDGDGYTELGGDCDDADDAVSPTGTESCDGVDEDCDGVVDDETACYDDDGDGWTEDEGDCNDGDASASPDSVEIPDNGVDDDCDGSVDGGSYDPDGDGYSRAGGDCAEDDASVYPGAPETANGVDDDCDGVTDEGTSAYDDDGDGVSEDDGDCDDADAATAPGAPEVDDGRDNDCDGAVDEGGPTTDDDGDGYSEEGGDCDDDNDAVSPDATEVGNGIDDDCDDAIDEGVDDADGDGYSVAGGDCDDLDGWTNPGAAEVCDGVDNDCDGVADEGCEDDDGKVDSAPGCACGVGGDGRGAMALFLVLGATVLRRRRSS